MSLWSTLKLLLVVSLSGTLPSLTTISSGTLVVSRRITALLVPRTTTRFVISPPVDFTVTGDLGAGAA